MEGSNKHLMEYSMDLGSVIPRYIAICMLTSGLSGYVCCMLIITFHTRSVSQ